MEYVKMLRYFDLLFCFRKAEGGVVLVRRDILVGMDIGTSNIRVIVGEIAVDGSINIIGVGTSPSEGIKKGMIIDLDQTVESIRRAASEAERMVGAKIEAANIGIVGSHVKLFNNRGVVAVARDDKEITGQDVERVLQAARVIALPQDKEIIDVIPREFIIDDYAGIRDPVGMLGVRLEVEAMVITGSMTALRNLMICVNRADYEVNSLILNSLANGEICLNRDEKELGVFLIDLGGGNTEIALFKEGALHDLAVKHVGGYHITKDLATILHTSFDLAERLKVEKGYALANLASPEPDFEIEGISGKDRRTISVAHLNGIIEPRVMEILNLCKTEMDRMNNNQMPPGGVVLTGGVSMMKGIAELAAEVFDCSVRIAQPAYLGVKSPIYSTAVGLIYYMSRSQALRRPGKRQERGTKGFVFNLWRRIRNIFANIWE